MNYIYAYTETKLQNKSKRLKLNMASNACHFSLFGC